jgi:RNA methyltransferase, TrmH family
LDYIQSKDNSLIKHIKKLREKKYRGETGQFLTEGFRFVEEALLAKWEVPYIFVNEHQMEKWQQSSIRPIVGSKTKIYLLKDNVFKTIAGTETPQGIIAVVNMRKEDISKEDGFFVLVDRIQDPGNMGTIIRTAHAGGALGVIYTKGTVDVFNEKTLRSTMGSIFYIPVVEDSTLKYVESLRSRGFKLLVSSLNAEKNFFEVNLKDNIIICIGNEGNGVDNEVEKLSDLSVKIPMPGGAESLNAAVAGSVMIYEAVRQRVSGKN